MKRLFSQTKKAVDQPEDSDVTEQPTKPLTVEDLVMPDIYASEHVATVPDLKIIDLSSPEADETDGFNPYDTAVLHEK